MNTHIPLHLLQQYAEQLKENIPHSGAVSDIQNIKKENKTMLDKLQIYLAELKAEAETVAATDDTAAIALEVAEFESAVRAKYAKAKEDKLNKINSDIDCVEHIIEREIAAAQAPVAEPVIGG